MQDQLTALMPKSKKAAMVFRAINHPLRQQILKHLAEHPRRTVTEIYCHFRLEQSVASQHLAILRQQGIVKVERNGKYIHYSVNEARIGEVEKVADELCHK